MAISYITLVVYVLLPNALGRAAMSSYPVGGKIFGSSVSFNHVVSALLTDLAMTPYSAPFDIVISSSGGRCS